MPSLWATTSLVLELISSFIEKSRGEAIDFSLKSFRLCGEEAIGDWVDYPRYTYLYHVSAKDPAVKLLTLTTPTPYLELIRLISNATGYINSLIKVTEISGNKPVYLHTRMRALWMLCN